MEKKEFNPTTLILEQGGHKVTNTHPWDANMYELLCSFIGACSSIGFAPETINTVIKEYAETLENND